MVETQVFLLSPQLLGVLFVSPHTRKRSRCCLPSNSPTSHIFKSGHELMPSILRFSLMIQPCTSRLRPQSYNPWHLSYSWCPSQLTSSLTLLSATPVMNSSPQMAKLLQSEHQLVATSLFIKYYCFGVFFADGDTEVKDKSSVNF